MDDRARLAFYPFVVVPDLPPGLARLRVVVSND